MSNTSQEPAENDGDRIVVARRVLTEALSAVEAIPERIAAHEQETMCVVERAFRTLNEMTIDTVNAIIEGIPAAINRHAPNTDPRMVNAICASVAQHAAARIQTLAAAKALLNQPRSDTPGEGDTTA